jgi:hypothetical protein
MPTTRNKRARLISIENQSTSSPSSFEKKTQQSNYYLSIFKGIYFYFNDDRIRYERSNSFG